MDGWIYTIRPSFFWGRILTARGKNFLENSIQKNVMTGEIPDDPLHASALATRCKAEAAAEKPRSSIRM